MDDSTLTSLQSMAAKTAGLERQSRKTDPLKGKAEEPTERLVKLKQACTDFEAVFIGTLIKTMRESIPEDGALKKSAGSDTYLSMADQQLSVFLSQGRGLGLGQAIFNQMVRREGLEKVFEERPYFLLRRHRSRKGYVIIYGVVSKE